MSLSDHNIDSHYAVFIEYDIFECLSLDSHFLSSDSEVFQVCAAVY